MPSLSSPRRQQIQAASTRAPRARRARRAVIFLAALCLFAASASLFLYVRGRAAATTFYSQGSLPPELFTSWNTQRGGGGSPPTSFTDGDTFVIQNTHNMSTLSPLGWTVSGTGATVEIESGGILTANAVVSVPSFTIDDGGTYIHNAASATTDGNAADIPGSASRTFKPTSTVTVKQWATSGSTAPAALPAVTWGNLTIDVATLGGNWQQSGAVSNVQGNLDIKTTGGSSNEFILNSSGALSLNLTGDLVVEGGILDLSNGAGVTTVNLSGNYTHSGGTLTDTGSGVASFNFTGGAPAVFNRTGGTLNDAEIDWTISGKDVQFGVNGSSLAFTNAASRTFTIGSGGGRLIAGVTINNNGALNVNGEFRLTDGGFATGNAFVYDPSATLAFVASGSYGVGDDPYWPASNGPANVNVLGAGVTLNGISRTVGNLFQTSAGVTLSGSTLTLNGTCQINGGGFFNNPPTYGSSSLLKYNIGGPPAYGRSNEWSPGATSGAGYPAHVQLSNNTTLNLPNGSNSSPFQMSGDLTIDSGSTLDMGAMTQPLTVLEDIVNHGTLRLSTAGGGDIHLQGSWSDAGTFTPNGRAVFFDGDTTQVISKPVVETFDYLVINKTAGHAVNVFNEVTVDAASGNALQLLGGTLNLMSSTITLSGDGGNLLVSGGARTVTGTGTFSFTGAKTVTGGANDSLVFDTGVAVTLSKGVNFGAGLSHVKGTLSIKQNGFVDTNPPVYDTGSTLEYDNGTSYAAAAEFPASGVQNVSLASTTQLNLNGDKSVAGTFAAAAHSVGTTAASPFSLSADTITLSTGTLNLNSVTTTSAFTATGAASVNVAGDWNVTGFSAGASTVIFDGTGAQVIQTASAFNNLTASNDISLGASPGVGGTLALGSHKITTGANTLSIGDAGTVSRTSGYIIGTEQKSFSGGGSFTFDVGTANGYSPVDANSTTGTGSLSVKPTQSMQPNVSTTNALSRYWTLNGTGLTTDLTFHYLDGDVSGTEANYKVLKHDTSFSIPVPQSVNTAANTATVNGVSSFSDWTLADPGSLFGQLQFAQANTNTPEGNTGTHTVDITVQRTGGSSGAVSVDYAVTDGTANAGSDYSVTSATGTLNWADADSADKTITITVNGDTTYEPNETVNITLSNPTGGAAINSPNPATLTITNDDAPPATLVVNTTADTDDGFCSTDPGGCTLREAINAANFNPDASIIDFQIPNTDPNFSGGVFTIKPTSALPTLLSNIVLDGQSQTTFGGDTNSNGPEVVVNGSLVSGVGGLLISGDNDTVQGLVVNGFADGPGIGITYANDHTPTNNFIVLNYVGTDAAGTSAVPNGLGVDIHGFGSPSSQAATNTVKDNLISGNLHQGVSLCDANATDIRANLIGTDRTGTADLGNGGHGIHLQCAGVSNSFIFSNTIAFNHGDGFRSEPDYNSGNEGQVGNHLTQNSIFSNAGLGINLIPQSGADGVTPNDSKDADTGANELQNFPVITSAKVTGVTRSIAGTLNSTPGQTFTIEFFSNPSCDSSGNGEGRTYLGNVTTAATDSNGDVSFNFPSPPPFVGDAITATATDSGGNTSEFSQCFTATAGTPGQIQFKGAPYTVAENGGTATITFTRAGGSDGVVYATFSTSSGTATGGSSCTPGVDFVNASGTVSWADGDTADKTAAVTICDDSVYEGNETANLALTATTLDSPPTDLTPQSTTTLTINEDDSAPTLSIDDVTHNEGDSGTTDFTFTVTKTGATAFETSVDFNTQDGTATVADGDYQPNSGTLQFAAADTTKSFTVKVNGDTKAELDETFNVVLTNPLGATVGDDTGVGTIQNDDESVSDGQLIITEFRLRGPGATPTPVSATTTATAPAQANGAKNSGGASGATSPGSASGISNTKRRASVSFAPTAADTSPQANDEFIELYNNTDSPLLVTTTDGSKGWALAASDGVVRFVVPDGTIIPARGHFLGVNRLGYSLSAYPAGNDGSTTTTATGDAILLADGTPDTGYTLDIPDNAGIAVFRTATPANFSTATRLDAAGSTSEANTLYKEGAGYLALSPSDIAQNLEHSFFRNLCSLQPGQGCTSQGLPKDTGDNGADFLFVDTKGTPTAAGQRLGAPGPENLSSHIARDDVQMPFSPLDRSKDSTTQPNRFRDATPNSPNASVASFGTLSLRRRVTNGTGAPVVQLRFRVIEITTSPAPAGVADLRALSSSQVSVSNVGDADTCGGSAPCTATVEGTTVEQPPEQLNPGGNNQGGGYNTSMSVGTIDLAHPLVPGASVNVQFLLGVRQTGNFRIFVNVEAVTAKD
jgi:CSLREA domain-containing protein